MSVLQKLKIPLNICLIFLGVINSVKVIRSIPTQDAYRKDFFQEYLLARAVIMGLPVYTPLPELATRLEGPLPYPIFPQPSPHPPAVLIFALPLGFFGYQTAMIIWLVVELTLLFFTCRLLMHRYFGVDQWWAPALLAVGLLVTFPVSLELGLGQLMLLTLFVLTAAWLALRTNNDTLGGALLGLSLAIKFIGWPLILFLLLRRKWKAVFSTAASFLIANLVGTLIVGFNQAVHYYGYVAPLGSKLYQSEFLNFSTWATGRRLFAGTSHNILQSLDTQPLLNAPALAGAMAAIVTIAVICLALALAHSASEFDSSVGVLICASTVVNPIAWHHYLVVLVIPAAITVKALINSSFPRRLTLAALLIGTALLLPHLDHVASSLAVGDPPVVPSTVGLLAFVPLVATLALMMLVWYASKSAALKGT